MGPCFSFEWESGPWGACTSTCNQGTRTRENKCYSKLEQFKSPVDASLCSDPEPASTEDCMNEPCAEGTFHWSYGEWGECSKECGGGKQERSGVCMDHTDMVVESGEGCAVDDAGASQSCNTEPCLEFEWFACEWSDCTTLCGEPLMGERDRAVYCRDKSSGMLHHPSNCGAMTEPPRMEECGTEDCSEFSWVTSLWGTCKDDGKTSGMGERLRT